MEAAPYRQACDRCHTQKLRCKREPDRSGGACFRCFKAKVQCVSSPSLRVRRSEGRQSEANGSKRHSRRPSEASLQSAFPDALSMDPISVDPMMESVLDFPTHGIPLMWPTNGVMGDLGVVGVPGVHDDVGASLSSTMAAHNLDGTPTMVVSSMVTMSPAQFDMSHESQQPHQPQQQQQHQQHQFATQDDAWTFQLTQINSELYQHSISLQRLGSTGQHRSWPFDQTFSVAQRLLRVLNEMPTRAAVPTTAPRTHKLPTPSPSPSPSQNSANVHHSSISSTDGGSGTALLVFSCYLRLQQLHASLAAYLESVDLTRGNGAAASVLLPSMSLGCFELVAHSPVYLPFVVSLSQSLLSQVGDAVSRVGGDQGGAQVAL